VAAARVDWAGCGDDRPAGRGQPHGEIEPRRSHSCDETTTIELEVAELRSLQRYVDATEAAARERVARLAKAGEGSQGEESSRSWR